MWPISVTSLTLVVEGDWLAWISHEFMVIFERVACLIGVFNEVFEEDALKFIELQFVVTTAVVDVDRMFDFVLSDLKTAESFEDYNKILNRHGFCIFNVEFLENLP